MSCSQLAGVVPSERTSCICLQTFVGVIILSLVDRRGFWGESGEHGDKQVYDCC